MSDVEATQGVRNIGPDEVLPCLFSSCLPAFCTADYLDQKKCVVQQGNSRVTQLQLQTLCASRCRFVDSALKVS